MSEYAYYRLSESNDDNIVLFKEFKPLVDTFQKYSYISLPNLQYEKIKYEPLKDLPKDDKFMLVCISGGKDSVATAKYYIDNGYDVILYHMRGINRAYFDEYGAVKEVADYLGCKCYIEQIALKGNHQYIEHPMKNILIANGAIQYCLDRDLPVNIAFGNYSSSKLKDMEFDICAGDSRDMWDIYEKIIQNEIPDFRINTPLTDVSETYHILCQDMVLFSKCMSCISPSRFRVHWKHRTEEKYGVKLMDNRCGCCWKCCMEYMVLADAGTPHNLAYYNHCFDILKKTARKETGLKLSDSEVWNRYFWYFREP